MADSCKRKGAWSLTSRAVRKGQTERTAPGSERTGGTVGSKSETQVEDSDRGSMQTTAYPGISPENRDEA